VDTETAAIPTCYRHDDRQTRLSCSRCGRPICVECTTTAPVGQLCPECAREAGAQRVISSRELYAAPSRRTAPVTFGAIAICVAVFLVGFVSPLPLVLGAQINEAVTAGQWWRLLSAAFLHQQLYHIAFNLYALYVFGPSLERRWGSLPFAGLYVGAAMAGGAAYYLWSVLFEGGGGSALGASGAIFGMFGATLVAAWRGRHTAAGAAGLRQLGTLLAINLALPLILPSIAWQAHVGGLLAGAAIAAVWSAGPRTGTAATVVRTAAGLAVAVLSVLVVALAPVLLA